MKGLVVGSHNRNELLLIRSHGDLWENLSEQLNEQVCGLCGDEVGLTEDGELFVACNDCAFPICKQCYNYERMEGSQLCPQCKTRFNRLKGFARVPGDDDEEDDLDDLQYEFGFIESHLDDPREENALLSLPWTDSSLSEDSDHGRIMWKTKLEKWKSRQQHLHGMKRRDDPPLTDDDRLPLSRKVPIPATQLNPYRMIIIIRFLVLGFFFHYRILHPVTGAYALWLVSVICEIWFAISWILDQLPKWLPVNRQTYLDRLSLRYDREGESSELPSVDIFVNTVKEAPLITANTILSVLAVDYPVDKVSCYISDDGASILTFEALAETCEFARKWIPFCKKYDIEPRAPDSYFSEKMEYLKDKIIPEFIKERRAIKREYEEFKVGMNGLISRAQKVPEEGWKMQDGTTWPGNDARDHPGMIQVILGQSGTIDGNDLPCLVYVSREKRHGFHHHKKAGAMNALLRVSALMTNAPYILNLDYDHYISNSKALREAMCFMMEPSTGKRVCFVQFPQMLDATREYTNTQSSAFSDMNMKGLDGIQGPMYMGSGCLLRRLALYGYGPQELDNKSPSKTWKCCWLDQCCFLPATTTTLEDKFGRSEIFISSTQQVVTAATSLLLTEAIHVMGCGYEEKTEWGKEVGWMYGCTAQDILTGFKMHCRGWRSIYSSLPAFRGSNISMNRAFGSVEIFLSRHCPLWCGYGGGLKWVQRLGYINATLYPLTSIPLLTYCTLPSVSLLTAKFITPEVNNVGGMLFISMFMCVLATCMLEMRWSGVGLGEWWRNEQLWVAGGVSDHLFAVVEGVVKVLAGIDGIDWSRFMLIPPTTLLIVNVIGVVCGVWNGFKSLGPLLMASWVIAHLYPFLKAKASLRTTMPTAILLYSLLLAFLFSLFWLHIHPFLPETQGPLLQDCALDCIY